LEVPKTARAMAANMEPSRMAVAGLGDPFR
jgi:hypothetical protein